jgi:hypothetical protein
MVSKGREKEKRRDSVSVLSEYRLSPKVRDCLALERREDPITAYWQRNGKVKITAKTRKKPVYQRFYDERVEQAVIAIWDFFRRACGKRLVPMIRSTLPALAGKFGIPPEVQAKLAATVSRSTVELMLRPERKRRKAKGTCATKPGTLLKQQIPVRIFWHWNDKKPGFTEIGTISNDSGGYTAREYAYTLTVTDVCL